MSRKILIAAMLVLTMGSPVGAASDTADTHNTEKSRGVTFGDIWRGLKSAEQNIEKEIPKIGPAIARTFKKITGSTSDKKATQSPQSENQ